MATITERTGVRATGPGVERAEPAPEGKVHVVLMAEDRARYVWGLIRMGVGWIFLWAFFDKVFGMGFATASDGAWINGGSPTFGFLNFGTKGPFAEGFKAVAGNAAVDWLFMVGLLAIGLALILGIGVIIASISGIAMLYRFWSMTSSSGCVSTYVLRNASVSRIDFEFSEVRGWARITSSLDTRSPSSSCRNVRPLNCAPDPTVGGRDQRPSLWRPMGLTARCIPCKTGQSWASWQLS